MLPIGKIIKGAKKATGAIMGIGQFIAAKKQRKAADAMLPGESAQDRQVYNSLVTRKRQLATGTANNADRVAARQMAKSMANNSFRTGGQANTGVISSALSGALSNINAQNRAQISDYDDKVRAASETLTGKAFDIANLRSQTMSARAEQNMSAARDNISATFATDGGGGGKGGKKGGGGGGGKAAGGVLKGVMGMFK